MENLSIYLRWEWTGNLIFRLVWKFCWDLSHVISDGNWLFRSNCAFSGRTLYPSANYVFYKIWFVYLMFWYLSWCVPDSVLVCMRHFLNRKINFYYTLGSFSISLLSCFLIYIVPAFTDFSQNIGLVQRQVVLQLLPFIRIKL